MRPAARDSHSKLLALCREALELFERREFTHSAAVRSLRSPLERLLARVRARTAEHARVRTQLGCILKDEGVRALRAAGASHASLRELEAILLRLATFELGDRTTVKRLADPLEVRRRLRDASFREPAIGRRLRGSLVKSRSAKKARGAKKAAAKSARPRFKSGVRPRPSVRLEGNARLAQTGKPSSRIKRSRRAWSPVLLGVAAPRAVEPGQSFTARFAAYVKQFEAETAQLLQSMADVEASVGFPTSNETQWKPGTVVTVRVRGSHFTSRPAEATFTWDGRHNLVHFIVRAKPRASLGKTQLVFEASIAGISVALIAIDVTLGKARSAEVSHATSVPYTEAFASYSSEDIERVADHLSGFNAAVRGTRVFMDCLELRRGEDWRRELAEQIAKTDMFLLFWSKSAAQSEWVDWEWRQAYRANKAMQAFRLDQPLPKLPAELGRLHADDRFQLARRAHAAARGVRAPRRSSP